MRHARLQKLQRLRREWPFYVFLFYGPDDESKESYIQADSRRIETKFKVFKKGKNCIVDVVRLAVLKFEISLFPEIS